MAKWDDWIAEIGIVAEELEWALPALHPECAALVRQTAIDLASAIDRLKYAGWRNDVLDLSSRAQKSLAWDELLDDFEPPPDRQLHQGPQLPQPVRVEGVDGVDRNPSLDGSVAGGIA